MKTFNFLGLTERQAPKLEKARFVVVPAAYEKSTSYRKGTVWGPRELLKASAQVEYYDEELGKETFRDAAIATVPVVVPKPREKPGVYLNRLSSLVETFASRGQCAVTVGGEHTLTYAPVAAYAKHVKDLSILHFDAHADLRASYEENVWSHACALRRSIEACQKQGGGGRAALVGIRSLDMDEVRFIQDNPQVKLFDYLSHRDPKILAQEAAEHLGDDVYVTIDLDGFDPGVIPGVGTPQPGGFGWYDALEFFREIFLRKRVVGFDVMELSPIEGQVVSEFAAAKLIYRLIGYISQKAVLRRPAHAFVQAE